MEPIAACASCNSREKEGGKKGLQRPAKKTTTPLTSGRSTSFFNTNIWFFRVEPQIYDAHHVNTEAAGFLTFRVIGFRPDFGTFSNDDPLSFFSSSSSSSSSSSFNKNVGWRKKKYRLSDVKILDAVSSQFDSFFMF